jgi:hypothetical protein
MCRHVCMCVCVCVSQAKLVAFMAPVDFTPPAFAATLFSNLFGHAGL